MFCKNCGSEIPANASYCQNCGTKVESTITETKKSVYSNIPQNQIIHTSKKWIDYLWIAILPFNLLYFMAFKITKYPSNVDAYHHTNGSYWLDGTSAGIATILTLGFGVVYYVFQYRNKNCKWLHMVATILCTVIALMLLSAATYHESSW